MSSKTIPLLCSALEGKLILSKKKAKVLPPLNKIQQVIQRFVDIFSYHSVEVVILPTVPNEASRHFHCPLLHLFHYKIDQVINHRSGRTHSESKCNFCNKAKKLANDKCFSLSPEITSID